MSLQISYIGKPTPKLKEITGQDYGTGASNLTRKIDHENRCIHGVLLSMTSTENTVTNPTLANMLTQMATNIQILIGADIVFDLSATDLSRLLNQLGIRPQYIRGGGTNLNIQRTDLFVPLGRFPAVRSTDLIAMLTDPTLGIRTTKDVFLRIIYPADGNNINVRVLRAAAVISDAQPTGFISRLTYTVTARATGWAADGSKWGIPRGVSLADFLFFQGTRIAAGTTADTQSIQALELEIDGVKLIEGRVEGQLLQTLMELETINDDAYIYRLFDPPIPVSNGGSLTWNAGDTTGAIRLMPAYVVGNPA